MGVTMKSFCEESYSVVAISTSHLTESDTVLLSQSFINGEQMTLQRHTGFFIKLYSHDLSSNLKDTYSCSLKDIIKWAFKSGYRMIEFDRDADCHPGFEVHEW